MRIPWTAPIAAVVACGGVATILGPVDLWLGGLELAAAVVILILPRALSPARERVASAASAPSAVPTQGGGVEAAASPTGGAA